MTQQNRPDSPESVFSVPKEEIVVMSPEDSAVEEIETQQIIPEGKDCSIGHVHRGVSAYPPECYYCTMTIYGLQDDQWDCSCRVDHCYFTCHHCCPCKIDSKGCV